MSFPSLGRARVVRVAGHRQEGAVGEDALATTALVADPRRGAGGIPAVVRGQGVVHVGLAHREEVEPGGVLVEDDTVERRRRLGPHGVGERRFVRELGVPEPQRVEPIDLRAAAGRVEHRQCDVAAPLRRVEHPGLGIVEQRVVGGASPKEVRHARRDLEAGETEHARVVRDRRADLDAIEELGVLQHRAQDLLDAGVEVPALVGEVEAEGHELIHFVVGERTPQCAAAERPDERCPCTSHPGFRWACTPRPCRGAPGQPPPLPRGHSRSSPRPR